MHEYSTARGLIDQLSYHRPNRSQWRGTSLYKTPTPNQTSATWRAQQAQQLRGRYRSSQRVYHTVLNTHLLQICSGDLRHLAIKFTQKINRCISIVTEDSRETTVLFQCLSVALQTGNAVSFHHTRPSLNKTPLQLWIFSVNIFMPAALCCRH